MQTLRKCLESVTQQVVYRLHELETLRKEESERLRYDIGRVMMEQRNAGFTLKQIGRNFGVSQSRVSQRLQEFERQQSRMGLITYRYTEGNG
jgi:DNA-directed RNA polymerase specialized sigma subunit